LHGILPGTRLSEQGDATDVTAAAAAAASGSTSDGVLFHTERFTQNRKPLAARGSLFLIDFIEEDLIFAV
jgi:hypothetical protein